MRNVASYSAGPPLRPPILHDNGFLDKFPPEKPTAADRARYAEWATLLATAEAAQGVPLVPHNDLPDALAAYRHFLYGHGADRTFSYERYVQMDPSGRTTLANAILDARIGAEIVFRSRPATATRNFAITGSAIACGSDDPDFADLFPYPETENWQKAIGAHWIWLSALITAAVTLGVPTFHMVMTLHAEDRYNFNPGDHDIKTGIPDSANGRFEVTGLAMQYMNYSTLVRQVRWTGFTTETAVVAGAQRRRQRKPHDNVRLRNRI